MTGSSEPDGTWPAGPQVPPNDPAGPSPAYGPTPPPDQIPSRFGLKTGVALVLLVAVGIGVATWSATTGSTTPSAVVWTQAPAEATSPAATAPASTPLTRIGNCVASDARTPAWRATVPWGWSCQYVNGREIFAVDAQNDIIDLMTSTVSPAAACSSNLLKGTVPVTALPDSTWGGKTSKTANFTDKPWKGQARCVSSGTVTYVMLGMAYGGTLEDVVAGEDSLAQSWVWTS